MRVGDPLPVYLKDREGNDTSDFVDGDPCTAVSIINPETGHSAKHHGMIDTGAEYTYIDHSICEALDLPICRKFERITVNEDELGSLYYARLNFPTSPHTIDAEVIGIAVTKRNRGALVLLGRNVLQHMHLTIDGPLQRYRLHFTRR